MACAPESGHLTLRFLREYMVDAPDDLGLGAAFVSAPPEPFVPPEVQGAPMFGLIICWTGDHEEGERVLAPIREVAKPMMDMVQPSVCRAAEHARRRWPAWHPGVHEGRVHA